MAVDAQHNRVRLPRADRVVLRQQSPLCSGERSAHTATKLRPLISNQLNGTCACDGKTARW